LRYAARRTILLAACLAVVVALMLADRLGFFGRAPQDDPTKYDGKTFRCVRVVDGDTLDMDAPDTAGDRDRTRVRLWGVDTPETLKPNMPPQHFGLRATDFTKEAALEKTIKLELEPRRSRDKYGRLLAYVYLPDGRMLNRVLIEGGYGYADPRFPHQYQAEFIRLQSRAKRAGVGLWKEVSNETLPYYYRDRLKLPRR